MNDRATKKRPHKPIGRRAPPRDGLVGRTEACRIIGCDDRQFRRWLEDGRIKPAQVDGDQSGGLEARWYEEKAMAALGRLHRKALRADRRAKAAAAKKEQAKAARRKKGRTADPGPDDYRPEREPYRPEQGSAEYDPPVPGASPRPSVVRLTDPGDRLARSRGRVPDDWMKGLDPVEPTAPPSPHTAGPPLRKTFGEVPPEEVDEEQPPSSKTGT